MTQFICSIGPYPTHTCTCILSIKARFNHRWIEISLSCTNTLYLRPISLYGSRLYFFGEGLQILTNARHSWPLSSEGSLACHTYCDTGHPFIVVISENPWHSHLLPSVWQWRDSNSQCPLARRTPTATFSLLYKSALYKWHIMDAGFRLTL